MALLLRRFNRAQSSRLSEREERISRRVSAFLLLLFAASCILFGLLLAYLIKSLLGIDLFDGFSLGIWDYFNHP